MIEGPPEGDWHYELITPGLLQTEQRLRVFYRGQTEYQHVEVMDGATFGRTLVLDGKTQSTEVDEFAYHEALVHPSMIAHPNPKSVFVAGGGEGATIREVMSHRSVEQVVMVDIDKQVVDLCREYLPNHHQGSFDDPRLELHHMDALEFLEDTSLRFDVVIIDVPDPLEAGPAYLLFTQEFYSLLKERLRPGGLMVAQSGPTGPAFYEQCFSAVANTVGSVFSGVYLSEAFVPSFGTTWGFVIGSTGPDPTSLSVEETDSRISDRIDGELRFLDGITLRGMTSVPKYLRKAVDAEEKIITRDHPIFVV
ncbi:MAG TPA: polyamine aminopropyltransferase [Dehalococcoidia bacterium]|jgi:spermidine synthase|nr:polyamine aminopropyltransferase [SAR202 cluster bacterium]PCH93279.1 MAG: polyamine aminopropyltransferase [Dehalococcoidia bacterium]MQG81980.1 polyamine aminopropyltransferase [SAR202 cluster bacterium]HAC17650.1 polyamine aminopropyltransferase [Dehalococcoidia bacterium]HBJ30284.1 polyamine aminopropyltransferase [Dehalococcoidia bacterium]|tara:strand:+ start:862 stop:1785 length:924 start_codon:yes stop_codon:yes gene_type:complete